MVENFQDNVSYGGSTLAVSGDAIAVGSTNAGAKSIIFNNSGSQGHLVWQPTANITVNLPTSGGTLQLSGQVPAGIAAGTQTATSGTVIFSNSNGISFGMSNSSVVTASYTVPSTAGLISAINVSAGTTSNNLSAVIFSNSNGLSFGLNGSIITGSYTVPTQTVQTVGLYALGNTTQNSSTTLDARSLSFNGLGAASVGYSNGSIQISVPNALTNVNISAGTTSNNLTAFVFSNSNNVSFGLNGSTITATITVPAQTNQTIGLYAVSNTTQNSSTTLDARTLSFQGVGIASVGYSNGSIVISVPSAGASINVSAGTTSGNVGAITFSNLNGVTFGLNAGVITASAAGGGSVNISAGTTSGNLTNFVFSNSNSVSFGLNGSTVTASVPAATSIVGVGGISLSTNGSTLSISASNFGTAQAYEINPFYGTASSNFTANSVSSGIASFFPFVLPMYVNAGHIQVIQSMAFLTVGTSSGQQTLKQSWGLYTRGTGTNSTTLGSIVSNSFSMGVTGNNSTYTINQPTTSNATGYGTGSTTSAGVNISSGYTGMKLVALNINSTLSPGNYWLGMFNAGSTSSVNVGISVSYMGVGINTQKNILAPIGSFSSAFSNGGASGGNDIGAWMPGFGSYSSAGQTNLPVSIAMSAISLSASNVVTVFPYIRIVGT